ncbi:hypothetical protein GCM10009839_23290 [Catenulispora yoronensis]|uniref:Uncharacterized protein n=1 Tax=Catenulispora yoronensis TaxID=450799 RepID=A0ABN2TZV9_9ACTN
MATAEARQEVETWLGAMWFELVNEVWDKGPEDFDDTYERDSLDVLEAFLLQAIPDPALAAKPDYIDHLDWAARYFGETLVERFEGCAWQPGEGRYAGLPVIGVPDGTGLQESPLSRLNIALERRTGHELTRAYDAVAAAVPARTTELPPLEERYADLG